jgi:TetR/AcrR family transcriptional regulator, transcriptional repressor of aconitase
MPKVTEAHRASRRDQITAAALACFARKGFQRTSMADIVAESGLSPGAIYLHFDSKHQIALTVGRQVLSRRLDELADLGRDGRDPVEAMRALLSAMVEDVVDARVLLQLWGEATADDAMRGLVSEILRDLGGAWTDYLTAWARRRSAPDPEGWARDAAPAILALAQGYLVQRALVPDFDPDVYFASMETVAGPGLAHPLIGRLSGVKRTS